MKFNKEQKDKISQNPNVLFVYDTTIHYTQEFKNKAILEYNLGKSAKQIFEEANFNLAQISTQSDYSSKTISKWRGSKNNNIHFPKNKIKQKQTAYQKLLARNDFLEAENEFLKKLQALRSKF